MPHVIIECSADIDDTHDLHALCVAVFDALAAHPSVADSRTLKIRVLPFPYWHIGTVPQSFAHAQLLVLPGRDQATKASMVQTIMDCMTARLGDVGQLTVDVAELDPTYVKRVL